MSTQKVDWDKYAKSYDSLLRLKPYVEMLQKVASYSARSGSGIRLDASCGTANFSLVESQLTNRQRPLVGIDNSPSMLRQAIDKCAQLPYCSFFQANLDEELPFSKGTFSQVISLNTIYAVKDPLFTLKEFRRVLEPGGTLLLVTPKEGFENGLILKEHCDSSKPDEYWLDAHQTAEREELLLREAVTETEVIEEMLCIAYHNRLISQDHKFHFFKQSHLCDLLLESGFKIKSTEMVYAKQDFFVTAS